MRVEPARIWSGRGRSARGGFGARTLPLVLGLVLLVPVAGAALFTDLLAPYDPMASVARPFLPPSLGHPFGTDDLGRDLLSQLIAGARTSLIAGLAVATLSALIGIGVGVVAGFLGGWIDDLLMRLTEIVQVVPRFFVAILVAGLFGGSLVNLILVLGLMSWPGLARIVRAEALSLRAREFVQAAVALGGGPIWVIRRHVLPNATRPIVATLSLIVAGAILTEAGLSYLGLADPNVVSWGRLIDNAQAFLYRAWWLSVFPGLAIVL
ncbi:MAG: ABC transporter permease, partial [Geminicoccaceae bacterium]|nr:ABC transporter permease [Geminicoccaceae bacterium]